MGLETLGAISVNSPTREKERERGREREREGERMEPEIEGERDRERARGKKERVGWHTEVGMPIKDSSAAVWCAHQHIVFAATIIKLFFDDNCKMYSISLRSWRVSGIRSAGAAIRTRALNACGA